LPIDSTSKVIGPRLLNSSQWGFIDPIDTPDGGNIGLHKHIAISTHITSGSSSFPIINWLRGNTPLKILMECSPEYLGNSTKVMVNSNWIGVIDNPVELVNTLKLYRRNGVISIYTSISFDYRHNEVNIFSDAGRLTRPIYYVEGRKPSFDRKEIIEMIKSEKITWEQIVSGIKKKADTNFSTKTDIIYDVKTLYPDISLELDKMYDDLEKNKSVVDYIDTTEEEAALIAVKPEDLDSSRFYTHLEIDPSLILGVMGNMIIYPENNPMVRNSFSCGQSKQAVSVYHSNYQMRIDKMGVVLNYGQTPLIKSRYLKYINNEEQPYGVNAIVAIMSYTGYNVEDAILFNEASVKRGIFRTTYYSMYEAREESSKVSGTMNSRFANIEKNNVIGIKPGYDYSLLDNDGLVKENTPLDDKIILIGKITSNLENKEAWIDDSVKSKKGQLGFVDKSFITKGEEGFNVAKVRIREERIPAIGDKMASRAGQKGTIGLIIREEDMPFTADGIRPDLIINPHALPSRMTIGQIVESLFGKVCALYGAYGDCTAFQVKGSNSNVYGPLLTKQGFHSSGNQLLYNGMTGQQLEANIYIGPTYYMRLKHMVKDKINYRARGPNTFLTRQAVQGRANDGGLRIGEMERDGVLAHGMSYFLNESFLIRGDEYFMAVCNKTGAIAIYNEDRNLFLSPYADGPVQFHTNPDGSLNIKNISKFGRSFSLLRIPYTFKLLIHELQCMNIQMRIITDKNIDNLLGMSYSDNINKLLQSTKPTKELINDYIANMKYKMNAEKKINGLINEAPILPNENDLNEEEKEKDYESYEANSPEYNPNSPEYNPNSPDYNPNSPDYVPNSPEYAALPQSPDESLDNLVKEVQPDGTVKVRPRFDSYLNYVFANMPNEIKRRLLSKPENEQIDELKELYKIQFDNYPPQRQEFVLKELAYRNYEYDVYNLAEYLTNGSKGKSRSEEEIVTEEIFDKPLIKRPSIEESTILDVEPEVVNASEENNNGNNDNSNNSAAKTVSFGSSSTPDSSESSNTTRKITL
jgi:DNA-directed RNA polymerase beta subunit